jgi:hypothetical protein
MKTVKAAQRLLAERASIDTPRFRYLDDAIRFLETIGDDARDSDALIRVQQSLLAHLLQPKDWISASLNNRKIDPKLSRVVIPSLKRLESQFGLSEELHDRLRLLDAVESQISVQFPDRKGLPYDEALGVLRSVRKKTETQLDTVLEFLQQIAEKHIPKAFGRFRQAIAQELEQHVEFEKSQQFLYVSIENEDLVFTNYFLLKDAHSEERTVPELYISLQWVVGRALYVNLNHEFDLPAQLYRDPGIAAQTLIDASGGFRSSLGD